MRHFITEIEAIDPKDGELKIWSGEIIEAPSMELARQFLEFNEWGYMRIVGEINYIIDQETGEKIVYNDIFNSS
jgi:hypothetical protein